MITGRAASSLRPLVAALLATHSLFAYANGSITSLRQEVGDLSSKLKHYEETRSGNGKAIIGLQNDMKRVQDDVKDLRSRIGDLSHDDLDLVKYLKVISWLVAILTTAVIGELVRRFFSRFWTNY